MAARFSNFLRCTFMFSATLFLFPSFLTQVESTMVPRRAMRADPTAVMLEFLRAHNQVRARHNLPSLKWSTSLANYAKGYANTRRGDCKLVHSDGDFGENLFWGQGNRWKASDAVAAWADEEKYYDPKKNTCVGNEECLHYTQLVWKDTLKVGCAKIVCNNGDSYIVCEYYPHGNVIGEKPY